MKMFLKRKFAMLLVLAFIVPLIWNQNTAVASAATPAFVQSKLEIVGESETYQLNIENKVSGSKYKWSSSNTKVAKVSSKGLVTSVNKGTATIKCKITYPSKKTKTLSCKVTVTIPAKQISISNAPLINGAYVMKIGDKMDFNVSMTPANTSDKTYWYAWRGDTECIQVNDSSEGIVTAVKAGKVVLRVKAAKSSDADTADLSYVDDAVIIEVVGPSATVKSVEMTSSNEIKVIFNSPVNQSTVIGTNGKLSDNIEITARKDASGTTATDPGVLTASLSQDLMTLTITSANRFEGSYGISFSNIKTSTGEPMEEYYRQISYTDTVAPVLTNITYDESGLNAYINFSEAIDITGLKIASASLVPSQGTSASNTSIAILGNVLNYTLSTNKKAIVINLSNIPTVDQNKLFQVTFSGVKDLAGNVPSSFTLTAYIKVDTTPKAQARILTVARTSYDTITATFDRAIQFGGMAMIGGSTPINGTVDTADTKKVNYKLTDAQALYTGYQRVQVGYWNSYNVSTSDTTALRYYDFNIDFTGDKTSPNLNSSEFDSDTGILTLVYNEDVNLNQPAGIFSSTYVSIYDDIIPFTNISYTNVTHSDGNNIIKLKLTFGSANLIGRFTFTLDAGFVKDNYRNLSVAKNITIGINSGDASELPAPISITQSATNLNEINIKFENKLDETSAETISNYSITGVTVQKAELTENTTSSANVKLTVGTISVTENWPITITGVKGYKDSYAPITSYKGNVSLKENVKPYYIPSPVFDTITRSVIRLNFSEQIQGTMTVKVTQIINNTTVEYNSVVTIIGSSAMITLTSVPVNNNYLRIDILTNNITDLSGNQVTPLASTLGVLAAY
jgi:hypothetical protein